MSIDEMITEEKNALIFKQILSTNSLRKFIEISRENLCKWGSVYISFSIEQVISAPENVVNLYRLCQYFCRFCRLHRSGLINRDVIRANNDSYYVIWDHISSNCMRKLSIVDCFGFCIQFSPSIVSRKISFTKAIRNKLPL